MIETACQLAGISTSDEGAVVGSRRVELVSEATRLVPRCQPKTAPQLMLIVTPVTAAAASVAR